MKKKKSSTKQVKKDGFSELINVHTEALMNNSNEIALMLEILKDKAANKNVSLKKDLKRISEELTRLNKDIDKLGD